MGVHAKYYCEKTLKWINDRCIDICEAKIGLLYVTATVFFRKLCKKIDTL